MRYGKRGPILVVLSVVSLASLLAYPLPPAQLRPAPNSAQPAPRNVQADPARVPRTRDFLALAGFVSNFGTASHGAGGGAVNSLVITNNGNGGAGVAAGHSIIVAFTSGPGPASGLASCQDTKLNAYGVDVEIPATSTTPRLTICSAHNVTALNAGDTITVNFPPNANGQQASASEFSGLVSVSPLDKTHTAPGFSTTPNSGDTAPTAQADELLFGAIRFGDANAAVLTSPGTGYALTNTPVFNASTGVSLATEYQTVAAIGAYHADCTISPADQWLAGIATYRAVVLPPTATPTSTPTSTATNTPTNTATSTPTVTLTATSTATGTNTPTNTATNTVTNTPTVTSTSTSTSTPTNTPSSTATTTSTNTVTNTATNTPSSTATSTPSNTPTNSPTSTLTNTPAGVPTDTNTPTSTSTNTPTSTATSTPTNTATPTGTVSPSPTLTATVSPQPGPVPNNIPTASEWALFVMGLMLVGAGLLLLRSGSGRV